MLTSQFFLVFPDMQCLHVIVSVLYHLSLMSCQLLMGTQCWETVQRPRPAAAETQSTGDNRPGNTRTKREIFKQSEILKTGKDNRDTMPRPNKVYRIPEDYCLDFSAKFLNQLTLKVLGVTNNAMHCIQKSNNERCSFYHDENTVKNKKTKFQRFKTMHLDFFRMKKTQKL